MKNVNASAKDTHRYVIMNYLMTKGKLTSAKAYELFGTLKLPSRISEILREGHQVKKERISVVNRFGKTVKVIQYSM